LIRSPWRARKGRIRTCKTSSLTSKVLKVYDHKDKEEIALKILKAEDQYNEQGLNEISILSKIKEIGGADARNVIELRDTFVFRKHIVRPYLNSQTLTFDLMDMNLYDVIKGRNFRGLKLKYIRWIAIHVLIGLVFLENNNIIHCDLKPENILLKKKEDNKGYVIKLIDFGSACQKNNIVYSYVQSRFYRAPEISLGVRNYDCTIDMWSFGCMIAELFTGIPLFPGESEEELLALIMELRGLPAPWMISEGTKGLRYYYKNGRPKEAVALMPEEAAWMRKNTPEHDVDDHYIVGDRTLDETIQCPDKDFIDFIDGCLVVDPKKRLTAKDALKHTWIVKGLKG
jgi:dual specificity tyrosine-phosphorylation-regulated kinase 2/3/4